MTTKHAGMEGLRWFVATVESIQDPEKKGRVGIRVLPIHEDTASIQEKDILWGMPIMPPNASSSKGLGQLHNIEPNSFVIGFFADGTEGQIPLIWGTWNGDGDLPPEVSSGSTTAKKIPIGTETPIKFGAKYPYNKVTKTKAGHMFEMDDTPSAERLHLYHKAGSYIEWDFMGSRNDATILNYHNSVGGTRNDFTKLIHNTIALGAISHSTIGAYSVAAGATASFNAGGTIGMTSGLATSMTAGGLASVTGGLGVDIKSPVTIDAKAPLITSAGAKVTMTGVTNKMQKFQLSEGVFNSIEYSDTINMVMNATGIQAGTGQSFLNLTAGGAASMLGKITTITGETSALVTSPALTLTGSTTTLINGGVNVLSMNGTGATWATGNMQLTPTGYLNAYPAVKFDVRSAAVSMWSSAATALSADTTFNVLAGTDLNLTATGSASLSSPGSVVVGAGAGGLSTTTSVSGGTITVGAPGLTTTVTVSATGAVTITAPAGAVEITAPVINMNGAVAVVGSLTLGGLPVKT